MSPLDKFASALPVNRAQEIAPAFSRLSRFPLRPADIHLYRLADEASGMILVGMVIFSPWAFGTTQPWSVGMMNLAGYLAGLLLLFKLAVRHLKGHRPLGWGVGGTGRPVWQRMLIPALAALTLLILGFILVSAINARATYQPASQSFTYHACVSWLPQSLDRASTWRAFGNYLALALTFWALRDWLLGVTTGEERVLRGRRAAAATRETHFLPARLRIFLWLLCVNGALLGLEGIVQRIEGSGRLLFLVRPRVNPDAVSQFGPWAYRANASQYFNLLWPVCLGFWWTLHRAGGFRRNGHHLLLVCAAIMAACPIISTSRGGAFISVMILVAAVVFLVFTELVLFVSRHHNARTRWLTIIALGGFMVTALTLGWYYGWHPLSSRLADVSEGFAGREEMFANARPMTRDYPWFGTGPGTFEPVFQLYRASTETYWPAQLHNDWLETRITFGWVGVLMILAALALVIARWYVPGGIHGGRRFVTLAWLALGGCLLHARFDFPFQIYSTLFLFLVIGAMLMSLTRRP